MGDRARAAWTRAMAFFGGDWPRRIAGRVLGERRATMLFWILDRYGQAAGWIGGQSYRDPAGLYWNATAVGRYSAPFEQVAVRIAP